MTKILWLRIALGCLLTYTSLIASAQAAPEKHQFAVWVNRSFSNGHVFGFAQNRELFLAEARYAPLLGRIHGVAVRYQIAIVPVALVNDIVFEKPNTRTWVYGGGVSPVGVHISFRPTKRINPFLSNTGGFLYFQQRVLSPYAAQFNFTVEIGAGAEFRIWPSKAIVAGYKYHHFSNANTAHENPALDSHMIFLGFTWFKR